MSNYFYDEYKNDRKRNYFYENHEGSKQHDYFYDDYEVNKNRKNEYNRIYANKFQSPLCNFFKNLNPGDDVDTLIIGGKPHSVDAFVSFDEKTGIVTFMKDNGSVFIIGSNRLDAIIIDN